MIQHDPGINLQKALFTREEAKQFVRYHQQLGRKVVFTNGCFDILHAGHVQYLTKAKALGDLLVIGLNADASVRRLKGEKRPINSEEDRAFVLRALKAVDAVVRFEEDTPAELIAELLPDVLVKGGDWAIDKIVGRDIVEANGGTVQTIHFLEGRSTTGTIEKILAAYT
ncbi:MAG: D-glycero-beta-D-manno-heptose 1-phosphate adenylyltransferase [Chlorobiales bacterium]|jgi:D-glycero-beta-D-manno-heptose 1-phosphate adenylyltransferase|nr:D-glycero-beta-D-manno-heptose 1-phosphate adenylyltransferase [Chlorobiales bacterium]